MKLIKKIVIAILILVIAAFILGILSGDDSTSSETMQTNTETTVANTENSPKTPTEESESKTPTESVALSFSSVDFYTILADNDVVPYELNEKAIQFLTEHDNLFPLDTESDNQIEDDIIDYSIEARHIAKNQDKYGDKLMMLPPTQVVQIQEVSIDDNNYLSALNLIDENGQQYYVLYKGELADIYDGDFINVIGLPLGYSQFENSEGGHTFVVVLAGSYVISEGPTG